MKKLILVTTFTSSLFASYDSYHQLKLNHGLKSTLCNRLCTAAQDNNLEEVQTILNSGINPNRRIFDGSTALHKAAFGGHIQMVKLLLDNKADACVKDKKGNTPLHASIEGCTLNKNTGGAYVKIIQLLLLYSAPVNAQNTAGLTPLACASIDSLSENFPHDLNVLSHPIMLKDGLVSGTMTMEEYEENETQRYRTIYATIVFRCPREIIVLLLVNGADFNFSNGKLLSFAYKMDCWSMSTLLLDHGAFTTNNLEYSELDTVYKLQNLINKSMHENNVLEVMHLLSKKHTHSPFNYKKYRALQLFLSAQFKHLFKAAEQDDVQEVMRLLKVGFPGTICDKNGNTLLHKAALSQSVTVFKLLLTAVPESIAKRNRSGENVVDIAATRGQTTLMPLLKLIELNMVSS